MSKSEKAIRKYVINTKSFCWPSDIAEHTIWGFKNAPYQSFNKAISKVKSVISKMAEEGLVHVEECEGYQTAIHVARQKPCTK